MIGRVRQDPVVVGDQVEIRPRVDMKITFDERVEDGLTAGLGLAKVKDYIENPETIRTGATDWQGKPPKTWANRFRFGPDETRCVGWR